jgi:crossover junction endodeoxyribonuclease RuvC
MTSPGFAMIEVRDRKAYLIAHTSTQTVKKEKDRTYSDGERIKAIIDTLDNFMKENGPVDGYIKEQSFARFKTETAKIYSTVGAVLFFLHDKEVIDISNKTIKKLLTGNGNGTKKQVEIEVKAMLNLDEEYLFKNDDESDACAVVLAYLKQKKLID